MRNDQDLRDRFAALRGENQSCAGEFHSFVRASRPIPGRVRAWLAVPVVLAVILAVLAISGRYLDRHHPANPQVSIAEWKSPTDFLLQTPGMEVLLTVPKIGEWPDSMGTPSRARNRPSRRISARKKD